MIPPDLPRGFWYDSVDSTQEEAKRLINSGQIQGTAFVVANHQAEGKGTRGRKWNSPAGRGIYLSIIHISPEKSFFDPASSYTLAAGVASIEAIKHVTGLQTSLKPVNDIYAKGKKLGGILVESDLKQGGITCIITGIGINVLKLADCDLNPISIEELLSPDAFSVFSSETLIELLISKVCFWYALLMEGHHGQVQRAWERYKIN